MGVDRTHFNAAVLFLLLFLLLRLLLLLSLEVSAGGCACTTDNTFVRAVVGMIAVHGPRPSHTHTHHTHTH